MEESFGSEELLFMMKKISRNMSAQMELSLKDKSITGVQVYFMVYILRHHPKGTYLTELCRELIKKMREKGYLYFLEDPDDVRKKKVLPTEKLVKDGNRFIQKADQMESEICSGLDRQEKIQLMNLEEKILTQLSRMEQNEKNRQEVYLP